MARKKVEVVKEEAVVVDIKLLNENAMPIKKTDGAACFDVFTSKYVEVKNTNAYDKAVKVPLGFCMSIPVGYHAKLFLRSSIGLNTKVRLANGTGIIDSDYRGEVCLLLENCSRDIVKINAGARIAQMLIEKNVGVVFEPVEDLKDTKRGSGGFGSTGE